MVAPNARIPGHSLVAIFGSSVSWRLTFSFPCFNPADVTCDVVQFERSQRLSPAKAATLEAETTRKEERGSDHYGGLCCLSPGRSVKGRNDCGANRDATGPTFPWIGP